jgi:(p)ppGpp synthase/HD superfamily hydrolase
METYEKRAAQLLANAINIAVNAHSTTLNKDGTLYILHPMRLMLQTDDWKEQVVAILHDVVEDTHVTFGDIELQGYDAEIIDALEAITKRQGEDYTDYIKRVAQNDLATIVKVLDLYDNIDLTRLPEITDYDLKRCFKYHWALRFLTNVRDAGIRRV